MRPSAIALLSLFAAFLAPLAAAQPSVDLRPFHASIDPSAGVYLEPAASPGTGEWSASLWLSYAYRPVVLLDPASRDVRFDVVQHQLTADFTAGVGIAERAMVGFALPVLVVQGGDDPTPDSTRVVGDAPLPGQAIGDLGLLGKLTLVSPTGGEFGGFALALHERFTLPTGDDASLLGEGGVTSETRLLAEYRLVAFGLHAATGVKLRAEEARFGCAAAVDGDTCLSRFGHELPFGLGLSFRPQILGIDPGGRSTIFLETYGHLPLSPIAPFESQDVAALELALGARYALRDVSFLAGVETALVGGIGTSPLRVMASVAWFPRVHDADGDGIDDDVDQCRELAEDRDGFQDQDGCPEGDNDEDGVFDEEDRCAAQKEDEDGFQDEDGCPDPDNDGDRILDVDDACMDEAGPASAARDKNGCPAPKADEGAPASGKEPCPEEPSVGENGTDGGAGGGGGAPDCPAL